jgi:hypothetical protein
LNPKNSGAGLTGQKPEGAVGGGSPRRLGGGSEALEGVIPPPRSISDGSDESNSYIPFTITVSEFSERYEELKLKV